MWAEGQKDSEVELLAYHEFAEKNLLDNCPEHTHARTTPWRDEVFKVIPRIDRKIFKFFHEFRAEDYRRPPVEGAVTTSDGVELKYRLDGNPDPKAPTIAFSNSLLTNYTMWDPALFALAKKYPHFRFLRYNTRGYHTATPSETRIPLLTKDLAFLLDSLKVKKLHALVGVSMGGITTLNVAVTYPERLERFIASDCNSSATEMNNKAWEARVALANSGPDGFEKLADQTVKRWTMPEIFERRPELANRIHAMILGASKPGFESCVGALTNYDLTEQVKTIKVPGFITVGDRDGVLPKLMPQFAKTIPNAKFAEIPDAGHIPMLENTQAWIDAIGDFLA